jgi:protein involved in polysaccharide export with SLBB domain
MKKNLIAAVCFTFQPPAIFFFALAAVVLLLAATGCETNQDNTFIEPHHSAMPGQTNQPAHSEALILREGDMLKISFSGSPNLNTTQQIRRDGKITLELVGEITAAGLSPSDLEKEISDAYGPQLVTKEVTVAVVSSSIPIFVTGAVLHPEKVLSDHPITALEAVMEAGGFDYSKADMKDVRIIRSENGREHTYILNLKSVMQGKQMNPFYLKPYDIIYVPERFSMF